MTAWIAETYDSRPTTDSEDPSIDLIYVIRGTDDDVEVHALVTAESPQIYRNLNRHAIKFDPHGGGVWFATVSYRALELDADFEFDTSGGSSRTMTSLNTLQRVARSGYQAPDYQGAINVSEDRVEGVDVTIPVYNFSETYSVDALNVTQAFKYNIFQLTGKVNNAIYKGFAKGEVLFMGATGTRRGAERWRITYKFAASPNIVNQSIGGSIDFVVTKEGWEYLWVRFDEHVNQNRLIKIPTAFYVEQVYPYGNLASLGIGT